MRTITLFFTQEGRELPIETSATTLGQLKQSAELRDTDLSRKKLTDRATRNTLENDDSVLPEGDGVIFVYPKDSKAGLTWQQEEDLLARVAALEKKVALLSGEATPMTVGKPSSRFADEAKTLGDKMNVSTSSFDSDEDDHTDYEDY